MSETTEPPSKRPKMTENIDKFIESIIESDKNLIPVLDDAYYKAIPLRKCYAGHIKDTKLLSNTIRVLNEKLPLKELQHLKRVNKHSVLLCPMDYLKEITAESIQDFIEQHVPELRDVFEYFKDVEVPSIMPLTKKQNIECNKKWMCNFHPNKYVEKILSDACFKQNELCLHRLYMSMAFHIARLCVGNNDYEGSAQDLFPRSVNAAVVVDPTINSVVTIAYDNRHEHPTQHASMLAIDNVAKTQNGGAWSTGDETVNNLIWKLKHKFLKAFFGSRKYVSKKDASENDNVDSSPYLCTGYDVYLIREPCLMCAMGLVHARVKRVFYVFENLEQGALHSKTKLHCLQALNHRFEVFTGFDV